MPDISVTINVPQGSIYKASERESIGTDGCGPCVGIIVVEGGDKPIKTCGHIDEGIERLKPRSDKKVLEQIRSQTKAQTLGILKLHFPAKPNVLRVGCCRTDVREAEPIIEAIKLYYGNDVTVSATTSIWATTDGSIHYGADQMASSESAPNGKASIT